jgi:hypothetical protein
MSGSLRFGVRRFRVARWLLVASLVAGGSIVLMPAASANDFECIGTVGAITVNQIVVPAGKRCRLEGTRVTQNISIRTGSVLVTMGAWVGGNIQGDGAYMLRFLNSDVAGNIQMKHTVGPIIIGDAACRVDPSSGADLQLEENYGNIAICNMTIREDLQLYKNSKRVRVFNTFVGENVQAYENTYFFRISNTHAGEDFQLYDNTGGVWLFDDSAQRNFQCTGNAPAPVSRRNSGDMEGQCVGL